MRYLIQGLILYFLCLLLVGAYMMVVYWTGSALWHEKSKGSLIKIGSEIRGSFLLAQKFNDNRFFKARPKEITNNQCNLQFYLYPFKNAIEDEIMSSNLSIKYPEMLVPSASGLDPYISLSTALSQVSEVSKQSGISEIELEEMVRADALYAQPPFFEMDIVNVTRLNAKIISYLAR